jgi:multidrug resistance protein, MATE family
VKDLDRRIFRLAVPSVLAALSAPLIGIADTAMVGHLPDVAFLGAVSTASLLFSVLYWSAGFLRMGTTSMVAQYYGAADRRSCSHILYRSLAIAAVLGIGMLFSGGWLASYGFRLAGGSADVQLWGARYLDVRLYEAPLVLIVLTLNGFFLGTANAMAPMFVTFTANLVNVAADYALIYGYWGAPEMGVVGAAWASVLGNAAALVVGLFLFARQYSSYWCQPLKGLWEWAQFTLIFRTNANLFGRTLCLQFAQFALLAIVSRLGEVPLAANAVVWQLWGLSSFAVDGFAHAAENLVGNLLGERSFVEAREMAARIIRWGMGIGASFGLLFLLALEPLARLFTQHAEVVSVVVSLRWFIALVQPLNAVVFVFDGIFIGANDMGYLFRAMAAASFLFFLPAVWVFVFALGWEMQGAWLAYNGLMLGRFATLWPRYRGDAWLKTFIRH